MTIGRISAHVEFQAFDLQGKWIYFRVAPDTSRSDVRRGDRFLQANFSLSNPRGSFQ